MRRNYGAVSGELVVISRRFISRDRFANSARGMKRESRFRHDGADRFEIPLRSLSFLGLPNSFEADSLRSSILRWRTRGENRGRASNLDVRPLAKKSLVKKRISRYLARRPRRLVQL
jgi:hypothetical protein